MSFYVYICLCKGITDKQIKQCVNNGATSFKQVRRELGVATQCCKCVPEARAIVDDTLNQLQTDKPHYDNPFTMPSNALFFPA